jgi:type II restriction enzyme
LRQNKGLPSLSFLSPDGGFLYLKDTKGNLFPILISEVKKQGTNHTRALEGLPKQAKGNAIERLGKNVLGFKVMLKTESIFPFVCFCYGSDFEKGSSIIDRVVTIASFAELNKVHLKDTSKGEKIGSYFVRDAYWTNSEMYRACYEVASKSIEYYLAKYGNQSFSRI